MSNTEIPGCAGATRSACSAKGAIAAFRPKQVVPPLPTDAAGLLTARGAASNPFAIEAGGATSMYDMHVLPSAPMPASRAGPSQGAISAQHSTPAVHGGVLSNSQFTTFVEHGVELDSEKYHNGTDQEHSPLEESQAARAASTGIASEQPHRSSAPQSMDAALDDDPLVISLESFFSMKGIVLPNSTTAVKQYVASTCAVINGPHEQCIGSEALQQWSASHVVNPELSEFTAGITDAAVDDLVALFRSEPHSASQSVVSRSVDAKIAAILSLFPSERELRTAPTSPAATVALPHAPECHPVAPAHREYEEHGQMQRNISSMALPPSYLQQPLAAYKPTPHDEYEMHSLTSVDAEATVSIPSAASVGLLLIAVLIGGMGAMAFVGRSLGVPPLAQNSLSATSHHIASGCDPPGIWKHTMRGENAGAICSKYAPVHEGPRHRPVHPLA
jgi:hypothetical protein